MRLERLHQKTEGPWEEVAAFPDHLRIDRHLVRQPVSCLVLVAHNSVAGTDYIVAAAVVVVNLGCSHMALVAGDHVEGRREAAAIEKVDNPHNPEEDMVVTSILEVDKAQNLGCCDTADLDSRKTCCKFRRRVSRSPDRLLHD